MPKTTGPLEPRFWAKVKKSDSCWMWTGTRTNSGYGIISLGGRSDGRMLAHRLAFKLCIGAPPPVVDHICRVRLCVRPEHLRAATPKQNSENVAGARSHSSSGVRCVQPTLSGKWIVYVTHEKKRIYGGIFEQIEDAEEAAVYLRNLLFTHNDADRSMVS